MEDARFDKLTRSLVDRITTRRSIFPLAGGLLAFAGGATSLDAKKRGHKKNKCKKKDRCGSKCCKDCFYKQNIQGADPTGKVCCPEAKLCKKAGFPQQCCYADEQCRPDNMLENNDNGLCCRVCGDVCCGTNEYCDSGSCQPLNTPPRLARRRI